jgi:hypothetical protein
VTKIYDTRELKWNVPTKPITVQECINSIINFCLKNKILTSLSGPIKN